MNIVYQTNGKPIMIGDESLFRNLPKISMNEEWFMGIDGSSTSYGLAIYNRDYSKVHLFTFCRGVMENSNTFREALYPWLQNYLFGRKMSTVTYEKTPEGYRPATSHAEKVMRETEKAVKVFVTTPSLLRVKDKRYIFDVFPNSWKAFSIPKSEENAGKVDKYFNAKAILESCGLNADEWLIPYNQVKYKHDYDAFEALGVGRYGSHYLIEDDGLVKVYKNFTRVGPTIAMAKVIDSLDDLGNEMEFIGGLSVGKEVRFSSINNIHSLPENIIGLVDKEYTNVLVVPANNDIAPYLDITFNFNVNNDNSIYIILATRASMSNKSDELCLEFGYTPVYI